jgi:hypothetical protein
VAHKKVVQKQDPQNMRKVKVELEIEEHLNSLPHEERQEDTYQLIMARKLLENRE